MSSIDIEVDANKLDTLLRKQIQKRMDSCLDKASDQFWDIFQIKLESFWIYSVQQFYSSYNPEFYSRRFDLYDLCQMQRNGKGLASTMTVWFDDYPGSHENDIYKIVFKEGYHGGSGGSKPKHLYRGPLDRWTHFTRPAIQTEAPYDIFFNKIKEYTGCGEADADLENAIYANWR